MSKLTQKLEKVSEAETLSDIWAGNYHINIDIEKLGGEREYDLPKTGMMISANSPYFRGRYIQGIMGDLNSTY